MQVRATQKGYYGGKLREAGETFSVPDEASFSKEWMEEVKAEKAAKPKGKADPDPATTTET